MAAAGGRSITPDLLFAAFSESANSKPRPKEHAAAYLARQTHLHLNDRKLTSSVFPPGACPKLKTLYIFDNAITVLESLGTLGQLTHLYCQHNNISAIAQDFALLTRLRKVHL